MTREEFVAWAQSRGWTLDRFGHLHKTIADNEYRYKLQAHSVRLEIQSRLEAGQYSPAQVLWTRLRSAYFSGLSLVDGKLAGMKR